jgi:hypothetical protein
LLGLAWLLGFPEWLRQLYEAIEPDLYRYPALDASAFRHKLDAALRRT